MAPEYALGGLFSEKSDVFSLGVILLEIVSGRRNSSFNNDEQNLNLSAYVRLLNELPSTKACTKFLNLSFFFSYPRHGNYGMMEKPPLL